VNCVLHTRYRQLVNHGTALVLLDADLALARTGQVGTVADPALLAAAPKASERAESTGAVLALRCAYGCCHVRVT
jgi:hypothetical protein